MTKIEWADKSWNPITGCTRISEGCKNCYCLKMFDRNLWDYDSKVRFHPDRLYTPFKWKKPRRIFVCSMSDLFHEDVSDQTIYKIFGTMTLRGGHHTYMILTKRPDRMLNWVNNTWLRLNPAAKKLHSNIWLGITAENQRTADERIPLLLQTPAKVRFVSVEPMLEQVNLAKIHDKDNQTYYQALKGKRFDYDVNGYGVAAPNKTKINWVICGAETGQNARPLIEEWVVNLANQCYTANVPFFMKKMGTNKEPPPYLMIREFPA